jgi:signal transduction histidine kinase
MAFNTRTAHLLAVILLVVASIFAYDSALRGYWVDLSAGILASVLLLVFIGATARAGWTPRPDPQGMPPEDPAGLHLLLDQVPVPLVSYSEHAGARAVNRSARSLFQTDDVIRLESHDLIEAITSVLPGTRPNLSLSGRQYAVSISEITGDGGYIRLATLSDVQVEIHKAEAAALRDTLHILSHEIMNSLTPVATLAEVAESYLDEGGAEATKAAKEALETLSRRAGGLARFVESYRSVARLPEPLLQPVDLALLLTDIVRLFSHEFGASVEIGLDMDDDLPCGNLDEAQVSQAVINVMTNAVEATEAVAGPRRVAVRLRRASGGLLLEISDNGPGVAEHLKPNLFNAFATTKAKGTGTGLNLARQIALGHGGNLQLVEDGRSGPTTFAFTFPVAS